jgi:putative PEP-CTERM system integral membrane protein
MLYEPVVYRPAPRDTSALSAEPQQAARLYQRFFDETIVEGEHQTIVNAASSTWSIDQAEAALQAVDEREVYLERQEVNVQEHGDWADVELYEVYRNRTADQQEVIYYFNLPESAAITGVWLGNSPDRERRFAYQVAPRGAAQAVYRNETRVMRDPALVEQIGPRQYRLRVYPVPPISMSWDDSGSRRTVVGEAPPLYMWLTYRALSEGEAWPLPRLAQNRNVYWDADTVRLINGAESDVPEEAWLPEAIPASGPVTRVAHRMDLPWGDSVLAVPVEAAALPALPGNLRLAVVLDRSRSMESHADQVSDALDQLREKFGDGGEVDVYLTSSAFRGEEPSRVSLDSFNPRETLYFGGQNAAQLLVQYEKLRGERAYDAVLVLTDGSGYELGESWVDVPIPDSPAWIVHLGSDIPLGYDDQTLEAIQASGGGVTGSLDQALERIAMGLSQGGVAQPADQALSDIVDGYVWSVLPAAEAPSAEAGSEAQGFGALAARRLILAEMQRQRGSLEQLGTLDRLHALAQEYSIVTPYSSMIVLVNYQQQQILEHLEQEADRYDREVEDLGDTTPATQTPLTGVPEPEEWLLMGMAVILLLWVASSRRLAWQRR